MYKSSDNLHYEKIGNNEPVCIEDKLPFEIPNSWEWVRLGNVCEIARGGSPRPIKQYLTESSNGVNWIKIGDTSKDSKYINSTNERIIAEGVAKSRFVHKGDFLLTNSMSFGRPYILNIDGCIHDGWLVLSDYQTAYDKDFLYYMLSSRFAYYQFCGIVSGAVVKNLNTDKVEISFMPLPPLSEQKRIVAKIEEILPHIDEYDTKASELIELNDSFPERFKKSILQEAVQGKLVPQDPSDEPASVLLDRIREEKARLVKEGKIKKDKNESVIFRRDNSYYEKSNGVERCIDEEIPFEIPNTWEWVRLISVCTKLVDGDHNPPKGELEKTQFIMASSTNINNDTLVELEKVRYLSEDIFRKENERTRASAGDILFTSVGSLGRSCIFDGSVNICFQRSVSVLSTMLFNLYLKYFFDSGYFQQKIVKEATGTAQKGFYLNQLAVSLIPVPPLAEQQRIVTKIEQLLAMIKSL